MRTGPVKGFSLIEVMVGFSLLSVAVFSFAALYVFKIKSDEKVQFLKVLAAERSKVEAGIKNPIAWNLTLNDAANNMSCAFQPPGCSVNTATGSDGYYDFVLKDVNGTKLTFDPADLTTRARARGGRCPAGIPDSDGRCPIKYFAQWKPLCSSYPCLGPSFDLRVQLVLESPPTSSNTINRNIYGINMFRGIEENTVLEACRAANGTYNALTNSCLPMYKNQTCTGLGKPFQVVTSVSETGNIDCRPLYKGTCDPTAEVVSGFDASGTVTCTPRVCSCQYTWSAWSPCTKACNDGSGPGSQTRNPIVTASPTNGGTVCPTAQTQSCNDFPCPINCSGVWSACSKPCDDGTGPGTQTYSVTQPAQFGGAACPAANGATQSCNTQICPVNCVGAWGACSKACDDGSGPGSQTYTITQPAAGSGAACPSVNGATQPCGTSPCPVNCVGTWSVCGASVCGAGQQMFNISTPAANGGIACTNAQGDCRACAAASCGWMAQQTFWGGPHPHNTARCNNAGGAEVTDVCDASTSGQLVQCCDIVGGPGIGSDCIQYRCNPCPVAGACSPVGSFYSWNGINWDDFGTPSWSVPTGTSTPPPAGPLSQPYQYANNIVMTKTKIFRCLAGPLTCGIANGATYSSPPTTNLCNDNTVGFPNVTTNATTYTWSCGAAACTANRGACSKSIVGPTYVTFAQDTASRPRCDAIYNGIGTWCTTVAEAGQVARCLDTAGGICDASGCSDGFIHTCNCP